MKNTNCKHCQLLCKTIGKTECQKYKSIAERPEQLKQEIKEAFASGNYEIGKKLNEELFRKNHG